LTRAVVDRGVRIPAGLVVGENAASDAQRFHRTERGVTLVTQPMIDALSG
jgi:glucose-1-phosphate adenylyltransferase